MKILFVVQNYYPVVTGGAGRSVQLLAEHLASEGHEVSVARLTDEKKPHRYEHNGVHVYAMPVRNIYYFYSHAKKKRPAWQRLIWHTLDLFNPITFLDFYKLLDEIKPDIVNTNTLSGFSTSVFYAVKLKKIKLVHTMRDYYLMCPQSGMYKGEHNCEQICSSCKPFAFMRRHAGKKVDIFLGNSQFVVDRHKAHDMLPDTAKQYCQFNMNDSNEIKTLRSMPQDKPIRFGFIGNINALKGTDVLIKACKDLPSNNWTLTVAGTGKSDFMDYLKTIAPENVNFIGWSKPEDFYNAIDVLICPSTYHDPLPRVIYEAYREGLPVIASDTGGNPEIVDHEKTGYLYPAKSVETLTGILTKFLSISPEAYAQMSQNALTKAQDFTPKHIFKAYAEKIL